MRSWKEKICLKKTRCEDQAVEKLRESCLINLQTACNETSKLERFLSRLKEDSPSSTCLKTSLDIGGESCSSCFIFLYVLSKFRFKVFCIYFLQFKNPKPLLF